MTYQKLSGLVIILATLFVGCGAHGVQRASVSPEPMPPSATFTGVYFSPQYGRMDMLQTDRTVVGEYVQNERRGRIQGTAVGNVMRFSWTEKREMIAGRPAQLSGRGYFQYIVDRDGNHKLLGEWGHESSEVGGGPWNAVKSRKLKPNLMGSENAGAAPAQDDSDSKSEDMSSDPLGGPDF